MSESVRAAHFRINNYPRTLPGGPSGNEDDSALVRPRTKLLSDLNIIPGSAATSKVFELGEDGTGIPGVRLFVRSEEQPYLRGAINALECLIEKHGIDTLRRCGVVGQERSPHVEDMAIAASAYDIPAFVMDFQRENSPGDPGMHLSKILLAVERMKIDGQQVPAADPDAGERPVLFPPHHHLDIIHGQGTVALQLEQEMSKYGTLASRDSAQGKVQKFGAVIGDMGNGCTLSGICLAFSKQSPQVYGAAPSTGFWTHAAARYVPGGPAPPTGEFGNYWKDTEIPLGAVPWSVFTSSGDLSGVFEVDDDALRAASGKVLEMCGLNIRPDEAAPLAVALYNEDFRRIAARMSARCGQWTVGIILQPRKSTLTGMVSKLSAEAPPFVPF